MNFGITLITVFYIVILIVPGIFFKKFYFQSKFSHEFNSGNFADKAITSIFWGLMIQMLALGITKVTFGIHYHEIYKRLNNIYTAIHNQNIPDISYLQLKLIFAFFCFSISLACILGHFSHKIIRLLKLDRSFSALRFSNEWNYIFRNELNEDSKCENLKYHTTEVDVIVKESKDGVPRFYSGILKDYFLTDTGQLDKIVLNATKKRILSTDNNKEFMPIKGDTFVIPYCNIENINLRYNYVDKRKNIRINPVFKQTISLLSIIILAVMLIIPWFTEAEIIAKLSSIGSGFISWAMIFTSIMNFIDNLEKIKKQSNLINYFLFILGVFVYIGTLLILDVISLNSILSIFVL